MKCIYYEMNRCDLETDESYEYFPSDEDIELYCETNKFIHCPRFKASHKKD